MRKYIVVICAAVAALAVTSCATVYSREWKVNAQSLTDALSIQDDNFRLERTSKDGTSTFEGKFEEHGDRWIFDIVSWKPANASLKRFSKPIRYIYTVHKFSRGVSFLTLVDVVGTSNFQFIQTGDFTIR